MSGYGYAFSLSKREVIDAEPPGTSKLISHDLERTESRGEHTVDHINLVPTPSHDPADPLNWPWWRKCVVLAFASLFAFVSNFTSGSLASALPILDTLFYPPETFASLGHLIAINVLMLGASNIWWVPLGNIFGRRPVMIVSTLTLLLCTMWCGLAKSFESLLVARFFQGCGGGPADTLAPDLIGEIFFVHQRGRALAFYTVFLALGPLVGTISGGYIAANLGYAYIHWIGVAMSAACFLMAMIFLPETLFDRLGVMKNDQTSPETGSESPDEKDNGVRIKHIETYPKFTFARSLRMNTYRGGYLRHFGRPWLTLRLPGVWMVMLQYGGLVGGIVTITTIGPNIVSAPPYLWGKNAGLLSVGGIIGTVLGGLFTAFFADSQLKRQAKQDSHGLAEPESRLPIMIPSLFLATTGLLMFGFCAEYPAPGRWVGLEVGFGMLCFALMQVPSIEFTYLIDAYNAVSSDCFLMITLFRAIISFSWTFFVGTWVERRGAAEPFGIFGMLMGLFSLLVFPIWLYGKRTRIATAKWIPDHPDH